MPLRVVVENRSGQSSVRPLEAAIYAIDATPLQTWTVPALGGHITHTQNLTLSIGITPLLGSTIDLHAVADPANAIQEGDETNNRSATLTVQLRP